MAYQRTWYTNLLQKTTVISCLPKSEHLITKMYKMRTIHLCFIFILSCTQHALYAQIEEKKEPYSRWGLTPLTKAGVEVAPFPSPPAYHNTIDTLQQSSYRRAYQVAYEIAVDYDLERNGTWQTLPNGDRVWRLTIVSRHAKALYLHYKAFHIPAGGMLHLYNEGKEQILGAFTEKNNKGSREAPKGYTTSYTRGDRTTLEYYEPANKKEQGIVQIESVFHVYEDIEPVTSSDGEEVFIKYISEKGCNIDAICPIGENWEQNRRSTVRLRIAGGYCSGVLVNNTERDGNMYILTAFHCINSITNPRSPLDAEDLEDVVVYWEYEQTSCGGNQLKSQKSTVGTQFKSGDLITDHALLSLIESPLDMEEIPDIYFSGWTRNIEEANLPVIAFHHPRGQEKKVTTFDEVLFFNRLDPTNINSSIIKTTPSQASLVGLIYNDASDGVIEPGSSGSGLFNKNFHLLGNASTGTEIKSCEEDGAITFSPLAVFWETGAAGERASDWLDRIGSQAVSIGGMDMCEINSARLTQPVNDKLAAFCKPHVEFINIAAYTKNNLYMTVKVDEDATKMFWKITSKRIEAPPNFAWLVQNEHEKETASGMLEGDTTMLQGKIRKQIMLAFGTDFMLNTNSSYTLYYAFEHAESGRNSRMYSKALHLREAAVIMEPTITLTRIQPGEVQVDIENTQGEKLQWGIVKAPHHIANANTDTMLNDTAILKKDTMLLKRNHTHSWTIAGLAFSKEHTLYIRIVYPKDVSEVFTKKVVTLPPNLAVLITPGENKVTMHLRADSRGTLGYKITENQTDELAHSASSIAIEKDVVYREEISHLKNLEKYKLAVHTMGGDREVLQENIVTIFFSTGMITGDLSILQDGKLGNEVMKKKIFLYPNPVKDNTIYLDTTRVISSTHLMDLHGKEMLKKEGNHGELDLSGVTRGTYLMLIALESNEEVMQKVIIE